MNTTNIAAFTKHHNDQPGFISINRIENGDVEIILREDRDQSKMITFVLSSDEFYNLVGQITEYYAKGKYEFRKTE